MSVTLAVTADLSLGTATGGGGNDTLANFENLTGGAGADILTGNDNDNVLNGGNGNDQLTGGDGNDTLIGGSGADALIGGDGIDAASYSGSGSVIVNLATGGGYRQSYHGRYLFRDREPDRRYRNGQADQRQQ